MASLRSCSSLGISSPSSFRQQKTNPSRSEAATTVRDSRRLRVEAVRPEKRKPGQERLKGIFEFVIDNPSSKTAIQLDSNPALDGNLGQLINSTKDKGRDYGASYQVGEFQYFVRETGSNLPSLTQPSKQVVFFHGAPSQSWSFRNVMQQLGGKGYRCLAPDFLGFGFSEKPQPGYEFAYTEAAYHEQITKFVDEFELNKPFLMVVQGFLTGSYALTWALKNPERLQGLVILNTPLAASVGLPADLAALRIPFLGEFTCQNAIFAEKFIGSGSPYGLGDDDSDVYRLPYLDSGDPGFALLETARKYEQRDVLSRIEKGFGKGAGWSVPVAVLWGNQDPYLRQAEAEAFAKNAGVEFKVLDATGHMPQQDWPDKVSGALLSCFSQW